MAEIFNIILIIIILVITYHYIQCSKLDINNNSNPIQKINNQQVNADGTGGFFQILNTVTNKNMSLYPGFKYNHPKVKKYLELKLKTFNVGSVIINPINQSKIYNHSTGLWINKNGSIGKIIIKEYEKNNNIILENDTMIKNPLTSRWVLKTGSIGKALLKQKQQQQQQQQIVISY